jgi:hypothetical protein
VLAHNNFIGRIIGKGGNIINTIKNETETKFVQTCFPPFDRLTIPFSSITVSSINELNSYNIERIISIKGELDQQMRALETIYAKLCVAYDSDNARAWNYSSQYYQQQQLMQHFAQQAAMMTAAAPLLPPAHYPQAAQSIIHSAPTNNSNGSSSKYMEQANPNAIYQPPYYVRVICRDVTD